MIVKSFRGLKNENKMCLFIYPNARSHYRDYRQNLWWLQIRYWVSMCLISELADSKALDLKDESVGAV